MRNMVMATLNAGKVSELQALLGDVVVLRSATQSGVNLLPEETGTTYQENARLKAEFVAQHTGLPAIADDSGLEVQALPGELGVRSARFVAGSDADRVAELLRRLEGATDRSARFVAVLALAEPGKETQYFRGEVEGKIAVRPTGAGGFGYDPVFVPEGLRQSFAELSQAEKNMISHRARAARALKEWLQQKGTK